MPAEERYFVDRDESGDYYYIPLSLEAAWNAWNDGGYEDCDTPPEGCVYIGGHASCVTFTDPKRR